ncbi:DegT/DnrJ/EryC1/StrS family aminotransferase [Candidatus Poriferisodalis sp.]|uniref:DegT/DnrJ/EryC1/StrS family aminotransferase n=1 Tax=Candidatus Poriferisodalis sp. TaxID=3101277 RepID=UPI003B016526
MTVWANKRLDMSMSAWLRAVLACGRPALTDGAASLERGWDPDGAGVVGLSVRSLFDLWIRAQRWRQGDRIVFSALTVADMPAIARANGLHVISLDIDPVSGEPSADALEDLMDQRTRAVVLTHLFGARAPTDALRRAAHANGSLFVEDCAEAYAGPQWRGHPDSDVALFSFGPIKTATAAAGGLARVRDLEVRDEMRRLAAEMPVQRRPDQLRRLLKFGLLNSLASPRVFGLIVRILDTFGPGHDEVLQRLTRGFGGSDLLDRIRRRPSAPLVRTLGDRLDEGDEPVRRRIGPASRVVHGLGGALVPTSSAAEHAYWLIPVLAPDPQALVNRLAEAGFHATQGRAFAVVEHDDPSDGTPPLGARRLFEHAVYLPFDPSMPDPVLDRLAAMVSEEARLQGHQDGGSPPDARPPPPGVDELSA